MADRTNRFQDPLDRIFAFLDEILVACPRCGERAVVRPQIAADQTTSMFAPRRLICPQCGLVGESERRTEPPPGSWVSSNMVVAIGQETDPYFDAPLWLATECRGHVLWAYNVQHLDLLEQYVTAKLRERGAVPGSMSLVERLPAWIKSSRNRDDVLRAIRRLRARAA